MSSLEFEQVGITNQAFFLILAVRFVWVWDTASLWSQGRPPRSLPSISTFSVVVSQVGHHTPQSSPLVRSQHFRCKEASWTHSSSLWKGLATHRLRSRCGHSTTAPRPDEFFPRLKPQGFLSEEIEMWNWKLQSLSNDGAQWLWQSVEGDWGSHCLSWSSDFRPTPGSASGSSVDMYTHRYTFSSKSHLFL